VAFRAALADVERHDVDLIVCLGDLEVGRWSQAHLGDEGLEFLRGFHPTVELDLSGTKLLCCHATPSSHEDVILPDTPRADVERMIGQLDADAVAAGHVHLQWLRRFSDLLWFYAARMADFPDVERWAGMWKR
jgi:predicted phosphodiesterase